MPNCSYLLYYLIFYQFIKKMSIKLLIENYIIINGMKYWFFCILTWGKICRSRPFGLPSFWRAEAAQINGHIRPSSRPQAMEGSPEGLVPLAPTAEDRPPRRRIKRQSPALTSIVFHKKIAERVPVPGRAQCRNSVIHRHYWTGWGTFEFVPRPGR